MSHSSTTSPATPRIYVACLAAYNAGHLHGEWIDCDQDADAIHEEIQDMLKASPMPDAEEWAIHDYEGFSGYSVSESEDIETVATLGQLIEEHGPAIALYLSHGCCDVDSLEEHFQDAYSGEWDSESDFAYDWHEQCGHINDDHPLMMYIDWDSVARDMFIDGFYSDTDENGVLHVFHSI